MAMNRNERAFHTARTVWRYLSTPGNACASLATITADTGIPRHSVVYALQRLKAVGHIEHGKGAKNARRVVTPLIEVAR